MITITSILKETVHPQKIFLKYVILRTVTQNYWRAAITAAPDARFESRKEKTQIF